MRKMFDVGTAEGFRVDTKRGVVYGDRGKPIGSRNKYGYIAIRRRDGSGHRSFHAHRLVWEAATGKPIPPGLVVDHLNGIKHDNRLVNLVVVTQTANVQRSVAMKAAASALLIDSAQRRAISATFGVKTSGEWAEELGVSEEVIHGIRLANLRECVAFAKGAA